MLGEFASLLLLVEFQANNQKFSFKAGFKHAFAKTKNLKIKQLIYFLGYFILAIPVVNVGLSSSLTDQLYIPKFITGEVTKTTQGTIFLLIVLVLLFYLQLRLIFAIPLTIFNEEDFLTNAKKSFRLTKTGKGSFLFLTFLFSGLYGLLSFLTLLVCVVAFSIIDPSGNNFIIQTILYTVISGTTFLFGVLIKLSVVALLLEILKQNGQIQLEHGTFPQKEKKKSVFYFVVVSSLFVGAFLFHSSKLYTTTLNEHVQIIAHRGYVKHGVENSLEALVAAKKAGANEVELDVVLTKDNQLVVIHDNDLSRLAGVNKKVREMNFDEVMGLPIKQDGHQSHIPSFEEFVKKAKDLNLKLLVEIKPYGGEPKNFADLIIQKVQELGVAEEYDYMSLDLPLMEELNQKLPIMKIGHVIPLQFGGFANEKVDFFVIEDFSYSYLQAEKALKKGKGVYVWTINDEDDMLRYLQSNVTGIITDYPKEVLELQKEMKEENTYK